MRIGLFGMGLALSFAAAACSDLFGEEEESARRLGPGAGADADGGGVNAAGAIVCDDRIHAASSDGRRMTLAQYQHAIADVFDGQVTASAKFPGGYGKSTTGYSTEAAINGVGEQDVAQIDLAAEEVAIAVAGALTKLLPCAAQSADEACAGTFLDKYARRAFRRALAKDERDQLLASFRAGLASGNGATFKDGVAFMVAHLLQTPQFLYVMEDAAPEVRKLSPDEVASRLSFLFWDSIPDDALLASAASGALADKKEVVAQATRLLASDKANTAVARLFREWTGTVALAPTSKDPATFPQFNAGFAKSMNESFDRFVLDQMRGQGTLSTLLRSPTAFVDTNMAAFYGVAAPATGQWNKVDLDPARYSGIATQGALLASLAHPTDASFVLRGKLVVTRLLCVSLGDPPANAQSVFGAATKPPDPTGKDLSTTMIAQPGCAGCHKVMNPPGLAFEHFDGIGRFRDRYASGKAIDTTGTLPRLGTNDEVPFQGPGDLMDALAKRSEIGACFSTQLFRFAMSRKETEADACAVKAVADALTAANGRMADALLALTTTDAFTHRIDAK